ncbi:hypothetical protein PIB30_004653 [Stylosanthes scabra]|uniref:GBF-interacting protein 1 N-terminal domain-containing protein n=1 Tax=Stylosanthes scabra TaxID=79078 RepID=A0ABU6Q3K9_9FABA|nr:hypothetical protein [Stylosanthes scabra]
MSGKNNGGGKGLPSGIPSGCRKMVQSLKEIVSNIPDHEIYAALKDCNMDPNEAVSRLLSQDPFHEVKSKRDKKKESKDITDPRPRGTSNTSSRGGGGARAATDRYVGGRGAANQYSNSDSGVLQAKPVTKKENGTPAYGGSTTYASSVLENNVSRQLPSYSDSVGVSDALSSSSQLSGLQSAWRGNPGQVSMADIVKMGRPQAKAMPNSSIHSGNHQNAFPPPGVSHHNLHSLQGHASKVLETNNDQGFAVNHNVKQNDEWPSIEHQPAICVSSAADVHANAEYNTNSSNFDEASWQLKTHSQANECVTEDDSIRNPDNVGSASISAKSLPEDNPESAPAFDGSLYNDVNSYQPHRHPFENNEAEDGVSSAVTNLEHLNLNKDDEEKEQEEDNPPLLIPNHLQVHTPECFGLSFGSFGTGKNVGITGTGPYSSQPLESNLEDTSGTIDVSTIGSSDVRNPDYYGDEHLDTTPDGNLVHRAGVDAGTYEHSSGSQPEALKSEPPETAQENQYSFHSSSHEFNYESAQPQDVAFSHTQTSSQMQNLSPFSSVMQGYTNSLPSSLLASTVQTAREDIPYSPFPATQSMPAKYSNIASSIGGPTITMSEALRANSISTAQPNQQALPASVATAPALPQHLAVHPYSQPTLPLGHFANMIGYPFMPQSYTYMPSAFQQAFAGNNTYHQSLAAVLPQYKNSVSVSSLPQSAAVPSGYGFGSSTSIPGGNFPLNPPTAPTSTTIGYEDVLNSQYKDNSHMMSLQQNENSPMWVQGPGSRTMSAVPPSTYYNFQGQSHQQGGFRQSQQPSQHFGPPGYPNFYQQQGMSLEHQQQNPREASLGGSQNQPSKQSQQLWQNSY